VFDLFIGCTTCKEGWDNDVDKGCLDINECLAETTPCKHSEFFVNTEGSHSCIRKFKYIVDMIKL